MKANEGDDCARLDAAFQTAGVYVNEQFHADKLLKVFENSLINATDKSAWLPIIEKSIATCEKCGKRNSLSLDFLNILVLFSSNNRFKIIL